MTETTKHYDERKERNEKIAAFIGVGEVIAEFVWDKHHVNGPEIHKILSNGVVEIYNERTKKFVTQLIARPNQLTRYWKQWDDGDTDMYLVESEYECAPQWLLDLAAEHQRSGYNKW